MSERQPGGASGVLLKSNAPCSCAYTDSFGFNFDGQRRFRVVMECGIIWSHRCIGKSGGRLERPALKCNLNMSIVFSTGLVR